MLILRNSCIVGSLLVFLTGQVFCQNNYLTIDCDQNSLFESDIFINDLCTISHNFSLEMEKGDLDAVLVWSKAEWFFGNMFEVFDKKTIDSLSLIEKKELFLFLAGVTKSIVEKKREYARKQDESLFQETDNLSITQAYIKSDLACVILGKKVVFLQKDENALWKAFRLESKTSDFKVNFIHNPD